MLRDMLFLARNGVPWAEVKRMSAARRLACVVAVGELDGRGWDWHTMRWDGH